MKKKLFRIIPDNGSNQLNFKAMTATELKNKVNEVFVLLNTSQKIDNILKSGCIDIESIPEDDYRTAKNILIAVLEDSAEGLSPLIDIKKHKEEIKKIKLFI